MFNAIVFTLISYRVYDIITNYSFSVARLIFQKQHTLFSPLPPITDNHSHFQYPQFVFLCTSVITHLLSYQFKYYSLLYLSIVLIGNLTVILPTPIDSKHALTIIHISTAMIVFLISSSNFVSSSHPNSSCAKVHGTNF